MRSAGGPVTFPPPPAFLPASPSRPPAPRFAARSIVSLGMFASYALSIARRSRGFIAGSAPPRRAATVTSLMSRVKILPFFASAAAFLCFTLAHLECPAMAERRVLSSGKPIILSFAPRAKPSRFMTEPSRVTPRASYRAIGVAMAIAGVVCFSLRPILIKLAYGYVVDPIPLLALRMIFSLPFFLAAAAWVGRDATRNRLTRRDVWAIVFLGFIGYYLASFVDFLGLQYVSAGLGRLILFLYPTLVVLLSIVFLHKRPSIREIVALVLTYSGIAVGMSTLLGDANANLR